EEPGRSRREKTRYERLKSRLMQPARRCTVDGSPKAGKGGVAQASAAEHRSPMTNGPDIPSGTVTFLFTDIEGSTRLLKKLRGGYAEVVSAHRRLLRAAFEKYAGREIDTQGDAFFVAFRTAKDAVAAAAAGQCALADHAWPEGGEVRVR